MTYLLGGGDQDTLNVTSAIELNDSDILRLEGPFRLLQARQGQSLNLEAFRQEILERFGNVGFVVDVKVWSTNLDKVYLFEVEILRRIEGMFDPDQMVHEVTNDILGLGTGGVLKSDVTPSGLIVPKHKH